MTQRPVNENLHRSIRAFVVSAFGVLGSLLLAGEKVPHAIRERFELHEDGSWSYGPVSEPEYYRFLGRHKNEIESLPEYAACRQVMDSDTVVSKHVDCLVGTRSSRIRRTSWDYLSHFLVPQLSQSPDKPEFDCETFQRMYNNLEQFFYGHTMELRAFAPLHEFSGDFEEMDLGKGLRLRTIMPSELEQLLDEGKFFGLIPQFEIPHLKYAMELTYRTRKVLGDATSDAEHASEVDARKELNRLLSALRLFRTGAVGFNIIKTMPVLDLPIIGKSTTYGPVYKKFWGKPYVLHASQAQEFSDFWEIFAHTDTEKPSPLSVAVRRFDYAQERQRLEDRLIDYMVAFEALFFKEGETGEFRHKLAVRTARLLRHSFDNRDKIAIEMGRFYQLRSAVVHGENVELNDEFIVAVENYLRESINIFLSRLQKSNHNDIIDRLDLG